MKPEKCSNCGNVEVLYWRKERRVCQHCAALNPGWGRIVDVDHVNFLDPINQPNALGTAVSRKSPCVYCGLGTYSRYRNITSKGHKIIFACGWGHAGYWMDRQTEKSRLAQDEAYVRRSLGMGPT
jgi:hypothetical protein